MVWEIEAVGQGTVVETLDDSSLKLYTLIDILFLDGISHSFSFVAFVEDVRAGRG